MNLRIRSTRTRLLRPAVTALSAASLVIAACGGIVVDPPGTTGQAVTSPDAGTITISGSVLDSTGFGVFGVTVTLAGSTMAVTRTDQNGLYKFTVKPGSYSLTPSITPGLFPPGFVNCPAFSPGVVNINNVTANKTVNFLGFGSNIVTDCFPAPNQGAMSGSLTISGVVTSGGQPVPGVKVSLVGSTQATRVSDMTGAYSFSVNPGSYSLSPSQACKSFSPGVVNLNNLSKSAKATFEGASCPPPPLALCPTFDALFGMSEPPACNTVTTNDCGNREGTWGFSIPLDFVNINFVDCRFGKWTLPPLASLLDSTAVNVWFENVTLFTLQLLGCPVGGVMTGPLAYPLIPPVLAGKTFTTGDIAALTQEYFAAINQALSEFNAPPLNAALTSAISAQIAFTAAQVPGVVASSSLTYSTCAVDAGGQ